MEYELFEYENDEKTIAGSDEAGRGPLAGPVVAACVVLGNDFPVDILNDSKKLNEKQRLNIEPIIKEKSIAYSIVAIPNEIIDKINILQASLLAMKMSYEQIKDKTKIDMLLVDGNKLPDVDVAVEAIVKGDSKIHAIMAASILAKNERDRIMKEYDKIYPGYGFAKHKGYPTKEHYEVIKRLGPSPIHRLSFTLYKEEFEQKLLF